VKYSRKQYITKIFEYRRRREIYRANYKGEVPLYKTERYILLTNRISQWTKEIKRIEIRKRKIQTIVNAVNDYFLVDIRSRSTNKDVVLARMIYFKYGLENRICGTHLLRHIGRKHHDVARHNRNRLNKSFVTNPENKQEYQNFKKSILNKNGIYILKTTS
jgi:hypothetical protein